jgi:hypothetical protein
MSEKLKVHQLIWSAAAAQGQNIPLIILTLRVRVYPLLLFSEYLTIKKTESTITPLANGSSALAKHSPHHPKVKGLSPANAAGVKI